MSRFLKRLMILSLGWVMLIACYPAPAPVQAYPPTPGAKTSLPAPLPRGQEIVYKDFRVTVDEAEITTSYVTEYGSKRNPPAGTQFLWIQIRLKNTGQVERPLPILEHFSVLYGTSEFKPIYAHRQGHLDYTTLKPVVYQGQQVDAWLRFDVPVSAELKDLQFVFMPESLQISIAFAPTDYPWANHPIYLWSFTP